MHHGTRDKLLKVIQASIWEARASYTAWKMLEFSQNKVIVGPDNADRYVQILKTHKDFLGISKHALLTKWVVDIYTVFDSHKQVYRLKELDADLYANFRKENQKTLDAIIKARNEFFAHKNKKNKPTTLPALNKLETFFDNLEEFYNNLTSKHTNSRTLFENANETVKNDTEHLFQNIDRGEKIRKNEVTIQYSWESDSNKASSQL